jgi:hypothetical protein
MAKAEYWIICFSEEVWEILPVVAGPWYGRRGKKAARARLKAMKVNRSPVLADRPVRFIVKGTS